MALRDGVTEMRRDAESEGGQVEWERKEEWKLVREGRSLRWVT